MRFTQMLYSDLQSLKLKSAYFYNPFDKLSVSLLTALFLCVGSLCKVDFYNQIFLFTSLL